MVCWVYENTESTYLGGRWTMYVQELLSRRCCQMQQHVVPAPPPLLLLLLLLLLPFQPKH